MIDLKKCIFVKLYLRINVIILSVLILSCCVCFFFNIFQILMILFKFHSLFRHRVKSKIIINKKYTEVLN